MGTPIGWTDCDASVTASFPSVRAKLSRTSQDWNDGQHEDESTEGDQLKLF